MTPFTFIANAVRAKEIVTVLIRNGFADLLQKIELPRGLLRTLVPLPREHRSLHERARIVAEELGPTFVKFGQVLSMRPDILPEPFILELRKLQDDVRAVPWENMEKVLEEEIGQPWKHIFAELDTSPVACASLAQVYLGRLHSGEEVAVKIQRPDIAKVIEADFDILTWFARQLHERIDDLRPYDIPAVVRELRQAINQELDFRVEARNSLYFMLRNPAPEEVFAPAIHEIYSGERVLVMERIKGRKLRELEPGSDESRRIAKLGARSIFNQILLQGLFHADPHAGNMIITGDGRLCFIDWGATGQLTRKMRYHMVDLFAAFIRADAERVVQLGLLIARSAPRPDVRQMERDIMVGIRENFNPETGQGEIGRAILRLLHIFGRNGIDLAKDYSLMAKAVLSIEETGKMLDPDFDIRSNFTPVLKELYRERYHPRTLWRQTSMFLQDSLETLQDLPGEFNRVLHQLEEDKITINLRHQGLEETQDSLQIASNKLTLGVIIGSLIIGSSLIITTGVGPSLFGYPALGIVGYLLSAVLGVWVIIDILRKGHR